MDEVRVNVTESPCELMRDRVLAYASYVYAPGMVDVQHTRVPKEAEGKGMASALTHCTLELIRARGEKLIPTCPLVYAYMRKHPETRDLLADPQYFEKHPPESRP
jgi:predicted GNAT family acetyltransferase